MRFEWDENKNKSNIEKHDIDFHDAALIFSAPMYVISDDRYDYGEERSVGFGLLDSRVVTVAFTEPEEDVVRIISIRRASAYEQKQYEHYFKQLFRQDFG